MERHGIGSIIYGPVSSWRLGKSLGIDMVSTEGKTCSFNCVYCQLGEGGQSITSRKEFVTLSRLAQQLEALRCPDIDYATFSGVAEPTLASNLGEAITLVRSKLKTPVAVLTNSSLMPREDVRSELSKADVVVAKLDAPTERLFQQINRPSVDYSLVELIEAIKLFRSQFRGKLALQMMFFGANKDCADEMAKLASQISADEIQINTPLRRSCAVTPLSLEEIAHIRRAFFGLPGVITPYDKKRPAVKPLDTAETLRRRPEIVNRHEQEK